MKTLICTQHLYYRPSVNTISVWWGQCTRWRCSYITLSIYNQTAAIMSKDTRTSHTTISQQRNDIIIGENFSSENQYQQYLKYLQQWTNPGCYLLLTWDSCSFGVRTNCAGMFKILHVVLYQGWCGYLSMAEYDCKFDDKSVFELSLSR